MLRMEIALILVIAFIAYVYLGAERKHTLLHRTFSVLLVALLVHLAFDGITIYTVNHLNTVPALLNEIVHRIFIWQEAFCHWHCHDDRGDYLCAAGYASHMADQRNGAYADDIGILSDAGKPGDSSGRAD